MGYFDDINKKAFDSGIIKTITIPIKFSGKQIKNNLILNFNSELKDIIEKSNLDENIRYLKYNNNYSKPCGFVKKLYLEKNVIIGELCIFNNEYGNILLNNFNYYTIILITPIQMDNNGVFKIISIDDVNVEKIIDKDGEYFHKQVIKYQRKTKIKNLLKND